MYKFLKKHLEDKPDWLVFIYGTVCLAAILGVIIFSPTIFIAPFSSVNSEWREEASRINSIVLAHAHATDMLPVNEWIPRTIYATNPNLWVTDIQARNSQAGAYILYSLIVARAIYMYFNDINAFDQQIREEWSSKNLDEDISYWVENGDWWQLISAYALLSMERIVAELEMTVAWTPYTELIYYQYRMFRELPLMMNREVRDYLMPHEYQFAILQDRLNQQFVSLAVFGILGIIIFFMLLLFTPSFWFRRRMNVIIAKIRMKRKLAV